MLLALLIAGCGEASGNDGGPAVDNEGEAAAAAQADTSEAVDLGDLGHDKGAVEEASIHVIEFSDFGCVHCQRFNQETFPALREEFIEPGHVAWKYIPVTVGGFPNVDEVTEVAECAAQQDAFFDLKSRLYQDPDAWSGADDPHQVAFDWAEEEGLDVGALRSCQEAGEGSARVQEQTSSAVQLGLQATPTFVINGQPIQGAPSLEAFRDFFRQELEEQAPPDG